jgi:ribose transport system permease protein
MLNLYKKIRSSRAYYSFVSLVVLLITASLFVENFFSVDNFVTIVRQACILLITSCGLTAVIITGNIDLSLGNTAAFVGCICAILVKQNVPILIVFLSGLIIGGFVGLLNGILVAIVNLPSFIATYGTNWIIGGLATAIMQGAIIFQLPADFTWFGVGYIGRIPVIIIWAFIFTVIMYLLLQHTVFGRRVFLIGSNPMAATYSGIPTNKVLIGAFIISSICAGFAGLIMCARMNAAEVSMASTYGPQTAAAVVLGGTSMMGGEGGIVGTFIGSMVLTAVVNIMNLVGLNSNSHNMAVGILMIGICLVDSLLRIKSENKYEE